jgi:hypothetical protein
MSLTLLRKLIRLHHRDWVDLLAAQFALLRAQLLVWTRRRGALLTPVHDSMPAATGDAGDVTRVHEVALALARAAEHGLFRPNCLVRAVALHGMLQSRGFWESSLRLGVRRESGQFLAHTWVEYRGMVLADQEWHVKTFTEMTRLGLGGVS